MSDSLARRTVAELLGSAFLLAAVVESGIMGERLALGNTALALLANSVATGGAVVALILTFGPISGAHFNPMVTLAGAWSRKIPGPEAVAYVGAQLVGGVAGVVLANVMFGEPAVAWSTHARGGNGQLLSECVATFGLLLVIACCSRRQPSATPFAVAAYIVAAYWFTASTSFANPAVTIARSLTNTFAGIRLADVPAFVAAQVVGLVAAVLTADWLLSPAMPSTFAVFRTRPSAATQDEAS